MTPATPSILGCSGRPTGASWAASPVIVFLEGGAAGTVVLLALVGGGMLLPLPGETLTLLHLRGADLLVGVSLLVLVASYASGLHRAAPSRWALQCLLFLAAVALYVLGAAAGPGEAGAEGRAHVSAALGGLALTQEATRTVHAVLGAFIAVGATGLAVIVLQRATSRWTFTRGAGAGVALVFLAAFLFPDLPAPTPDLPELEAARPPWPAAPLVPLEARLGVGGAALVGLVTVLALLAVPFLDRPFHPPWVRWATTTGLVAGLLLFLTLLVYVSLAAPGGHPLIRLAPGGGA